MLGGYRRGPGILRHPRPTGVLRRIGACAKGFGPHQREPAPAEALQSPTSAGVLHGRAVQHPRQRASRQFYDRKRDERLLHSQALLALARRLVDVLWALLRDGREFSPHKPTTVPATA
jgi:hypothetical protein